MNLIRYYILSFTISISKIIISSSYESVSLPNNDRRGGAQQQKKHQDLFQAPPAPTLPSNNNGVGGIAISMNDFEPFAHKTVLTGKISWLFINLMIDIKKAKEIWSVLQNEVHALDVIVIGIAGWIVKPVSKFIREHIVWWKSSDSSEASSIDNTSVWSYTTVLVDIMSEISKIASLVYVIDVFDIILTEMGFEFAKKYELSHLAAKTFYTVWAGNQIKKFKYRLIQKEAEKHTNIPAGFINRALNVLIYTTTALLLVETFQIQVGVALSSIFAFGGVGTLVFSLASKDFASELLSGMVATASQKYDVGNKILLGDGTYGYVTRLGWYDMDILGDDSMIKRIPYSEVGKKSVVNLTRNKLCQVKQILRFQYQDMDIIDDIIQDIKNEITNSTSIGTKLILDGSRPFRILITSFEPDHIAVKLNTHYRITPRSNEHHVTRHHLLKAVSDVMKKYNTTFALPIMTMNEVQ